MSTELEEKPATELTVVERAALALGADEGEKQLIALSKKYVDIVAIANKAGRDQVHSAAMALGQARIDTDKTGKAAREDALAFQKAVIAEAARRVAIVKPEEDRLLALRDSWDAEREAEKEAKRAAEQTRIADIRSKIETLRNAPARWINSSSEDIGVAADFVSETVITLETFMEFTGEAQAERDAAVKQLRAMQESMRQHEEAQAELARRAAELAEQERAASEARAEQERKDRAARLEQERRDHEVREQEEADRREAQRRAQEAMDAEREAHEARMAAQQAEIDAKQVVIDAAIAEQERIAREARETEELERRRLIVVAEAKRQAEEQDRIAEEQRVQAEKDAAEAAELAKRQAAEAEAQRRERVQFELNGPGAPEMVALIATHYEVEQETALNWLNRHVWAEVNIAQ